MLPLVVTSLICGRDEQEMSMMIDDFYEQNFYMTLTPLVTSIS